VGSLASSNADPKAVLAACDEVRDGALVDLGVRLEDKADGESQGGPRLARCLRYII